MEGELAEIAKTWDRIQAGDYSLPACVRLLGMLNDRLRPIVALDPLTEVARAGLTVGKWLDAVQLQGFIIEELLHIDP